MKMRILTVNDTDLGHLLAEQHLPVVVLAVEADHDPSQNLDRTLQLISGDLEDHAIFVRIWSDENPVAMIDRSFVIFPTLAIFRSGRKLSQLEGFTPAARLRSMLDEVIASPPGDMGEWPK